MAGAQRPPALAPFACDWVGGDIHGLSAFAGEMYGYVPEINGVTTALDKQVGRIVGDAGWQGPRGGRVRQRVGTGLADRPGARRGDRQHRRHRELAGR